MVAGLLLPSAGAQADYEQHLVMTRSPKMSGSPRVAHTLSVSKPLFRHAPDKPSYRWMKDGTPITGAWNPTYRVSWRDLRHRISVSTVSTRPAFATPRFDNSAHHIAARGAGRGPVNSKQQE